MLLVFWGLLCWTDAKWSLSPLIPNSHWMGFISAALLVQKEIRIGIASSAPSWDTGTAERGLISPFLPSYMIWRHLSLHCWTGILDNLSEQDTEVLDHWKSHVMHLRRLFFFPQRHTGSVKSASDKSPVNEIYISVKYFCPQKTKMSV